MLIHSALFVRSMERSLDFYQGKLGYQVVEDTFIDGGPVPIVSEGCYQRLRMVLLKAGPVGIKLELLEFQESSRIGDRDYFPPAHQGSLTFVVPDLAKTIEQLRAHGLEPASSIFVIEAPKLGRSSFVFYRDPDGHRVEFLQQHR